MKRLPYISLCLLALVCILATTGCNNDDDCDPDTEFYPPSGCDTDYPLFGDLSVRLTLNDENPSVVLEIYRDSYENGAFLLADTVSTESVSYTLDLDETYSVAAYYKQGRKTIIAIDGDRLKRKENQECGWDCYTVKDGSVNVRLKE